MLMLVCFRCIQVSTYEEGHRCSAYPDCDDSKETENVLLIDYESVNSIHDFTYSNGEAYKKRICGEFNHLSESIHERMNIGTSFIPTVKQASVSNFDLFKRSRSTFKNNYVSHSETYKKVVQITVKKGDQSDIITRSLPIKDCLKSEKASRDFKQLDRLVSVNEDPQQDNHSLLPQPQVAGRENASAALLNQLPSSTSRKVDQITVNKCDQGDIITRSLPIKDSLKSEKSPRDFKQLDRLVSVNEAPQQDNYSLQPQTQVAGRENASAIFKNNHVFHSETYKKVDQITVNKCEQNDIITRSLPIKDSLKSEKSPRDFKQLDRLVSVNEAPQQDNHSLQPQPQVADRENASAALLNHLPSSTSKKVFRCEKCTLVMATEMLFNLHVKNDCDQKPFKCDQCPMKFYLSDSLVVHQLVHTKEQGFQCKFCTYTTQKKKNMKRHVLACHVIT